MLFHIFGPGKFSLFYQNVFYIVNEWKERRKEKIIFTYYYSGVFF